MSNLDIVLKSIDLLKEDMKPDWGKMSCSQMVKHCNRFSLHMNLNQCILVELEIDAY